MSESTSREYGEYWGVKAQECAAPFKVTNPIGTVCRLTPDGCADSGTIGQAKNNQRIRIDSPIGAMIYS